MGGSSKAKSSNIYDYSQSYDYSVQQTDNSKRASGSLLGVVGGISNSALDINITDGGAVEAAARVSERAIAAAEKSNLEAFRASAEFAGQAVDLSELGLGLADKVAQGSQQMVSESQRLAAANTQSALDFAKQIGRADGGEAAEIAKYGMIAAAAVTAAMIIKGAK